MSKHETHTVTESGTYLVMVADMGYVYSAARMGDTITENGGLRLKCEVAERLGRAVACRSGKRLVRVFHDSSAGGVFAELADEDREHPSRRHEGQTITIEHCRTGARLTGVYKHKARRHSFDFEHGSFDCDQITRSEWYVCE